MTTPEGAPGATEAELEGAHGADDEMTDPSGEEYRLNKPLAEMTDAEQVGYWRYYARRNQHAYRAEKPLADKWRRHRARDRNQTADEQVAARLFTALLEQDGHHPEDIAMFYTATKFSAFTTDEGINVPTLVRNVRLYKGALRR